MSEKQRREGFRKAEASLRLEGMDPREGANKSPNAKKRLCK